MRARPSRCPTTHPAQARPGRFGDAAEAASLGLAQLRAVERQAAQTAQQAALARAAKTLNESLEPSRVLVRICEEAAKILGAENAAVYLRQETDDLRMVAVYGQPVETLGSVLH